MRLRDMRSSLRGLFSLRFIFNLVVNNKLILLSSTVPDRPPSSLFSSDTPIFCSLSRALTPLHTQVDSRKGITNLHVPSDIIIDASMPVVMRDSGTRVFVVSDDSSFMHEHPMARELLGSILSMPGAREMMSSIVNIQLLPTRCDNDSIFA